jgi:hypothetical protein
MRTSPTFTEEVDLQGSNVEGVLGGLCEGERATVPVSILFFLVVFRLPPLGRQHFAGIGWPDRGGHRAGSLLP